MRYLLFMEGKAALSIRKETLFRAPNYANGKKLPPKPVAPFFFHELDDSTRANVKYLSLVVFLEWHYPCISDIKPPNIIFYWCKYLTTIF